MKFLNDNGLSHLVNKIKAMVGLKADKSEIPTKVGQLDNDKKYVTESELGDAGYGDMVKGTYDKNNNGIVDRAEIADSVEWDKVLSKPSVFNPASHNHDTSYLRKTGDTIAGGDLRMDGGSVAYIRPVTTGGWARGFWWMDRNLSRIGGIGVLGSGTSVSKFYIGYGVSPWTNSIIEAYPSYVNINGKLRTQQTLETDLANTVATKKYVDDNIKTKFTWGDLKGV